MESIIKKAIEGGYSKDLLTKPKIVANNPTEQKLADVMSDVMAHSYIYKPVVCDSAFWIALGRACGWGNKRTYNQADQLEVESYWKIYALRFHEINLTESWDKAVEYLSELIK